MAPSTELRTPELQAIAYHMFTACADARSAFDGCMAGAQKNAECAGEYKALMACAKTLLADATAKAAKEFKEYSHCLDLTAGKYAYCRPEKTRFETAFPLLKDE